MQNTEYINIRIHIEGMVQGIGFRPFVYRTAVTEGISGTVENTGNGVDIHARGTERKIKNFIHDVQYIGVPPAAIIQSVSVTSEVKCLYTGFKIVRSSLQSNSITRISPDMAVCDDCLEDMRKQPERLNYPFINCTNCGPRFSIIRDIPYDREKTTMAAFEMCDECLREFTDINNRRFHAQPIACTRCGPVYYISDLSTEITDIDNIIRYSAELIDSGRIIALMGMGGYHLICNGRDSDAVETLRHRKKRETKPFALMMPDIRTIRNFAILNKTEEELLTTHKRPIVLLKQIPGSLPDQINNGLDTIGVMLPYMPFHFLLFEKLQTEVLLMSSGNRSNEPIVISHEKAVSQFEGIADCIVSHTRRIHNRVDDSVVFASEKKVRIIRRSRGWVPDPILTDLPVDRIAAFGGELKSTFALGRKNHIILSQHIGDLENMETMEFFQESYSRFKRLFKVEPELFVHDKHPDYLSTRLALKLSADLGHPAIGIQHHEAHIASVIVEHGLKEPVIAVCYDGSGYGNDGTIWGGEIFSGGLKGFQREIHLQPIKLPGGDTASKHTWRTALSFLYETYGDGFESLPLEILGWIGSSEGPERVDQIQFMLKNSINSPLSSSMGRLFDCISALTGICFENRYEGEAPMLLEAAANPEEQGFYPWGITENIIDSREIIRAVVQDILKKVHPGVIAARFMNTVIQFSCDSVSLVMERTGIKNAVLSGGVFQNRYLLEGCESELRKREYKVYSNSLIPANDGGLALGQIGMGAVSGG